MKKFMGDAPPEKKKVLFVESTAEMVGGGQQSLLGLLRFLNRDLFSPTVIFPSEGPFAEKVRSMGIPVFFVPMGSLHPLRLFQIIRSIRSLVHLLRNERIDIVHTNASRTTLYAGLASRVAHVPLIWHVRIAMREPVYDRFLYLLAWKVIAISQAVAARFPFRRSDQKVSVVYNGLDLDSFSSVDATDFRRRFGLEGKIVVGQVGQIDPLKGPMYLIQAVDQIRAFCPNVHGLIVGAPTDYQRELEDVIHGLQLDSHITFTGWQEDVRKVMSALDILIAPSATEGFGRVLIEGMACNRPVVAFSVDAIPEIIEEGQSGLLVERGDLQGLVGCIRSLIEDAALRRRIAEQGKERVKRLFDIRENVNKTQEIYELCKM